MKHDFEIIVVRWIDHFASDTNEPHDVSEVLEMMKPCIRETSGYYIGENKRVLAIAGTIEENGQVTEINFLMKKGVISRSDN